MQGSWDPFALLAWSNMSGSCQYHLRHRGHCVGAGSYASRQLLLWTPITWQGECAWLHIMSKYVACFTYTNVGRRTELGWLLESLYDRLGVVLLDPHRTAKTS